MKEKTRDYKPDPNRQSLNLSAAEFFGLLGEFSLSAAGSAMKTLAIVAGFSLLIVAVFVFITSAVAVGVAIGK